MDQIIQFAMAHPYLSGGLVVVVALLIYVEVGQRFRGFREVSPAQAVPLINRNNARVVDVSSHNDYQAGHIIGAEHAPKTQWEPLAQRLLKHPEQPVVVVDKNGQATGPAATALVKAGLKQVVTLKGGMLAWRSDNYPVSRPAGKAKPKKKGGNRPKKRKHDSQKPKASGDATVDASPVKNENAG